MGSPTRPPCAALRSAHATGVRSPILATAAAALQRLVLEPAEALPGPNSLDRDRGLRRRHDRPAGRRSFSLPHIKFRAAVCPPCCRSRAFPRSTPPRPARCRTHPVPRHRHRPRRRVERHASPASTKYGPIACNDGSVSVSGVTNKVVHHRPLRTPQRLRRSKQGDRRRCRQASRRPASTTTSPTTPDPRTIDTFRFRQPRPQRLSPRRQADGKGRSGRPRRSWRAAHSATDDGRSAHPASRRSASRPR